jgi:DNA-directed RNA polymerase specialized sigma24 family protein
MKRPLRNRLAFDLHAHNGGSPLEALSHELRRAQQIAAEQDNPEYRLFLREQEGNLERLRSYVERLDPEERSVLHLYFHQGLTARETATRLGMASPRRAYTVLSRVVRRLRLMFDSTDQREEARRRP